MYDTDTTDTGHDDNGHDDSGHDMSHGDYGALILAMAMEDRANGGFDVNF